MSINEEEVIFQKKATKFPSNQKYWSAGIHHSTDFTQNARTVGSFTLSGSLIWQIRLLYKQQAIWQNQATKSKQQAALGKYNLQAYS